MFRRLTFVLFLYPPSPPYVIDTFASYWLPHCLTALDMLAQDFFSSAFTLVHINNCLLNLSYLLCYSFCANCIQYYTALLSHIGDYLFIRSPSPERRYSVIKLISHHLKWVAFCITVWKVKTSATWCLEYSLLAALKTWGDFWVAPGSIVICDNLT